MKKFLIKSICLFIMIISCIFSYVSCGEETLSGTYTCKNQLAQVTKLTFSGNKVTVTDLGVQVECTYQITDGIIEMNGTTSLLGTTVDVNYDYKIEIEGDSIFLNGVEYTNSEKTTNTKNEKTNTDDNFVKLDPFKDLEITYTGINTYGNIEIDTTNCEEYVRKNIKFVSNSENVANGDVIVITAQYDLIKVEKNLYEITSDTMQCTVFGLQEIKYFNPFDGLEIQYNGISPYGTISLNDGNCPNEVQEYAKSTFPQQIANGETIIVTRYIDEEITKKYGIAFSSTTKEYTVINMPEYVISLDDLDLSEMEKELGDYVISQTTVVTSDNQILKIGYYKFINEHNSNRKITKVDTSSTLVSKKFLARKLSTQSEFSLGKNSFNIYELFYKVNVIYTEEKGNTRSGDIYAVFLIYNIIKYPDGSVKWGLKSANDCDFYWESQTIYEDLQSKWVTQNIDAFNIIDIQ